MRIMLRETAASSKGLSYDVHARYEANIRIIKSLLQGSH